MPVTAWLFVAVPATAIVLGSVGSVARAPRSRARSPEGCWGGIVFASLVGVVSLASALWLSVDDGDVTRLRSCSARIR